MERFDFVKLINDNEELRAKNIFKGYSGVLISYINATDEWIVEVLDPHNSGRYAVAKISAKDLRFSFHYPERDINQIKELSAKEEFYTHTELKPPKFKEYDKVRLIKDKSRYEKEGVKKGTIGCIISTYAIMSEWEVIFSEEGTARDIADIDVHEDDLELVEDCFQSSDL